MIVERTVLSLLCVCAWEQGNTNTIYIAVREREVNQSEPTAESHMAHTALKEHLTQSPHIFHRNRRSDSLLLLTVTALQA